MRPRGTWFRAPLVVREQVLCSHSLGTQGHGLPLQGAKQGLKDDARSSQPSVAPHAAVIPTAASSVQRPLRRRCLCRRLCRGLEELRLDLLQLLLGDVVGHLVLARRLLARLDLWDSKRGQAEEGQNAGSRAQGAMELAVEPPRPRAGAPYAPGPVGHTSGRGKQGSGFRVLRLEGESWRVQVRPAHPFASSCIAPSCRSVPTVLSH